MTNNTTQTNEMNEQRLHEIASDLCDLVRTGDLTPQEANEWMATIQDRMAHEPR